MHNSDILPDTKFGVAVLKFFSAVMVLLALLLVMELGKNMTSHNFWFDEAGQYWVAVGQNHYSPAGTADGSIRDVWYQSRAHTLDPGGFTLVLHFIIRVLGSTPAALRIAPAFFGLAFLYATFHWSKKLGLTTPIALAICSAFMSFKGFTYYFLELRPYSMELCGVVALGLATMYLLASPRIVPLLLWIGVDCLFSTSRYSFVVYSVAACVLLLWGAIQRRSDRKIFATAIVAAGLWNALIYVFVLRLQSASGEPPAYVQNYLLATSSLGEALQILQHNFLDNSTIAKSLYLIGIGVAFAIRRWSGKIGSAAIQPRMRLLYWTAGYVAVSELGWLLLSATGKMPWDASLRWSFSEYGLTAMALPALIALIWMTIRQSGLAIPAIVSAGASILICALCLRIEQVQFSNITRNYNRDDFETEQVYGALTSMTCSRQTNSVVLDESLWPHYRYLVERSGLTPPCSGKLTVRVGVPSKPAAFANLGLTMGRPVLYLFGTWDKGTNDQLLNALKGKGEVENRQFGQAGYTYAITLK